MPIQTPCKVELLTINLEMPLPPSDFKWYLWPVFAFMALPGAPLQDLFHGWRVLMGFIKVASMMAPRRSDPVARGGQTDSSHLNYSYIIYCRSGRFP